MIAFPIGLLLFTYVSATTTGREALVFPSVETLRSGEKRMHFRALDQEFQLRLQPAGDVIGDNFFIQTTYHGHSESPDVDVHRIKRNLYKDHQVGASLYIEEKEGTVLNGILNENWRIKPHRSEERREDGRVAHRVFEVVNHHRPEINDAVVPPGLNQVLGDSVEELRAGETVYVETCIVTDTKFSASFSNDGELTTYLSVFINGMQTRYDNLESIRVSHVLSSVTIVKSEEEEPYINNNLVEGHIKPGDGLNSFAKFVGSQNYSCDIAMLVTKRPLGSLENGKIDPSVVGIAYIGSPCSNVFKSGIAEDNAETYTGLWTYAHESAHILGCPHDGEGPHPALPNHPGSSACPWNDGYIMSYLQNSLNQYYFSACCEKNIIYVAGRSACLRQNNTNQAFRYSSEKPGEALENKLNLRISYYRNDRVKYYNYRCQKLHNDTRAYQYPENSCSFKCITNKVDDRGYHLIWTHSCIDAEMCGHEKRCLNGLCQVL